MRCVAHVHWQGQFLTGDRVRGYCVVLLVFELACFAFLVAGTHGWIVPLDQPNSSDFVSFYAAGSLADDGTAALAYDKAAHYAREQQATEPGIGYNFFFYPPIFLLLCAALARLPYLAAFILFQAGCLLPCLILVRRIVGPVAWSTLLAFPAVFWAIGTGQNALLTAALLAGATLLMERSPLRAGLLLGALCYKPHLAMLVPVALLAGGHWRAMAGAALSVVGLAGLSLAMFGWGTWRAFATVAVNAGSVYASPATSIDLAGLTSPYGFVMASGGDRASAMALQAAVVLGAALAVAECWRRPTRLALRAAVLLAALPLVSPVAMFYDLMVTGVALAWLVRDGREHGFPPWQPSLVALAFLLPLLSGNTGFDSQIGIPPLAAALGFGLALRQAFRGQALVRPAGLEPATKPL